MILYKYTRARMIPKFLLDGTIAFARIDKLNDPFESSIESTIEYTKDLIEIPNIARTPIRMVKIGGMTHDMVNPYFDKHSKDYEENSKLKAYNIDLRSKLTYLENGRMEIGILSLTETPKNVLMWAHYAENSKGICLGFDMDHAFFQNNESDTYYHNEFFNLRKVQYQNSLPSYSKLTKQEYLERAFFAKYIDWSYEKEHRILRRIEDQDLGITIKTIPTSIIKEVYLGLNISEQDKNEVLRLTRKSETRIYQIIHQNNSYSLETREVLNK